MRLFAIAACMVAVVLGAPFVLPDYHLVVLNYIGLASITVIGLVLLTGGAGITSFGQAAFVGLGAYTTGYLTAKLGYSPWVGLLAGCVLTCISAYIIGMVTLSLSGHYLALSTIAWGTSLFFVFGNIEALGGHTGLSGIPPIHIPWFDLGTNRGMFWLIWTVVLLIIAGTNNILDSRIGRSLRALKSNTLTAESFGVNTTRVKVSVFIYAALLSSIAGWLYAHFARFVNPTPFSLTAGVESQFMAVIGGVGSVWGALIGSSLVLITKEYLQTLLPALLGSGGNFEIIVYGILVLVLLQMNQDGGLASLFLRRGRTRSIPVVEPSSPLPPRSRHNASGPILSVANLKKRFGGVVAVNDVSFDIAQNEIVALVGPNGAGKTTTFNLISGADRSDEGKILFKGVDIANHEARDIVGLGIARTFQHVHLVEESSVIENAMLGAHLRTNRGLFAAAFGLKSEQEKLLRWEARQQLHRVGLQGHLNTPASSLALGQQRIVEIARALAADPDLLLLDEPAAGLRSSEKRELAELILQIRDEGRSVLLVEHDMNFVASVADRIIVMNFGEKLTSGLPAEIQSDPRVIEAYLGREDA